MIGCGRVARPFGPTITVPGGLFSRTRLFPEITGIEVPAVEASNRSQPMRRVFWLRRLSLLNRSTGQR